VSSRIFARDDQGRDRLAREDATVMPARRAVLRAFAATGIAIPPVWLTEPKPVAAAEPSPALCSGVAKAEYLARGFRDPVLELIRLLHTAADIEHASLLQYMFAAFSLKNGYESIGDYDASGMTTNLLGMAIDNMVRFGTVNRLLAVLGAPSRLAPPRFPFNSGVYPFAFNLEPLTPMALAQYIYREAPNRFFDFKGVSSSETDFIAAVCKMLNVPATRAASLYAAIAAMAGEVTRAGGTDVPDLSRWIVAMHQLEERGAEDRFAFLKNVFLGSHPAFAGRNDVWRLPMTDQRYPSYGITSNPASCPGRPAREASPTTLALIRLGNLQYGTTLLLLDLYFRHHLPVYRSLAVAHMTGPVRVIGKYLAPLGTGMPFEAIDVPDSSALDAKHRQRFILALLQEGQTLAESIGPRLPPGYPLALNRETMAALQEISKQREPR